MSDGSILLLGTAKVSSTRTGEKMVRPFGGTTLMHLYVRKFKELMASGLFADSMMAIPSTDTELKLIAAGLPVFDERPKDRTHSCPRNEQLYYLADRTEKYVLWLNGCLPFLKVETVERATRFFLKDKDCRAMTATRPSQNWYWTAVGHHPVNNINWRCCSTRKCEALLASTHAFHIFDREMMVRYGAYWGFGPRDPYLWEMREEVEGKDVHTDWDFMAAEAWYKANREAECLSPSS